MIQTTNFCSTYKNTKLMKTNLSKETVTAQVTKDVANFSRALNYLHKAELSVLDALLVQCTEDTNANDLFVREWELLFDAVEKKMKQELADAASENALQAASSDADNYAI